MPFTGSSIATAVVSATVGAAWAVIPSMTPVDVMELVALHGVTLDGPEPNPWHAPHTGSRVAFCAAVRAAALAAGRTDPGDECVTPPARSGSNPRWVDRWSDFVPEVAAIRASGVSEIAGSRAPSAPDSERPR